MDEATEVIHRNLHNPKSLTLHLIQETNSAVFNFLHETNFFTGPSGGKPALVEEDLSVSVLVLVVHL